MNFIEALKSSFQNIISNKMRSFLTMLGIVIGISSVIMIMSVGNGSKEKITGEFDKLGVSMLTIRMKEVTDARDFLKLSDVQVLKMHPQVQSVAPVSYDMGSKIRLRNPKETKNTQVIGTNSELKNIEKIDIMYGRFLMPNDDKASSQVTIIDNGLALKVFGREDVIGEKIHLKTYYGSYKLTVVGVIKNPNAMFESLFGDKFPAIIYMPIETFERDFSNDSIGQFVASIKDSSKINDTSIELTKMLERKHRNKDKYYVDNVMKNLEQINMILTGITAFISFVAGISLFVGGIGVMNIMLVTVTERTREIGIRKSLGATNKDILVQFLIEAIIITMIGGIIGIAAGYAGGLLVGSFIKITPSVSILSVTITVLISSAVGIIFGVFPARKAARLDPIEAMRYE
jgi:putative ABC transport system permease protein